MPEIVNDLSKIKLGDAFCYHVGNLAADRQRETIVGEEITKRGTVKYTLGGLTKEAESICELASKLYLSSTAAWDEGIEKRYGSGEYVLYQKKIGFNKYEYWAKKVSDKPVIRKYY